MENHPAMVLAEMLKHNLKIFFSFKNNVFRKGRFAPSHKTTRINKTYWQFWTMRLTRSWLCTRQGQPSSQICLIPIINLLNIGVAADLQFRQSAGLVKSFSWLWSIQDRSYSDIFSGPPVPVLCNLTSPIHLLVSRLGAWSPSTLYLPLWVRDHGPWARSRSTLWVLVVCVLARHSCWEVVEVSEGGSTPVRPRWQLQAPPLLPPCHCSIPSQGRTHPPDW